MPRLIVGSYERALGFRKVEGELGAVDRQLAWELASHITTRVAVRGKIDGQDEDTFRGEVLSEGFDELEDFATELRGLMVRYPVGQLEGHQEHLGAFIALALELVVRQFLEKWQSEYRSWWELNKEHGAPFVVQRNFIQIDELLRDWTTVRRFFRDTVDELVQAYGFVDVLSELSSALQSGWYEQ